LSDLPTVPSKTDDDDDENDAHSNVAPPDATAPSLPPPYDQPSAVPPTDASLDIQVRSHSIYLVSTLILI